LTNGNFEQIFDARKLLKDGITNTDQFIKQKIVDLIKRNATEFKIYFKEVLNEINNLSTETSFLNNFKAL